MESIWTQQHELKTYPRLNQDLECDYLIIGGGLTGIALAYRLQETGKQIVLLEKNQIGGGMSSLNHGKISVQHGPVYQKLAEKDRSEYLRYNQEARLWIENCINELKIDCQFTAADTALFASKNTSIEKLKEEAEIYEQLGLSHKFSLHVEEPLPMEACLTLENQAQYDPLAFLLGLASHLKDNVSLYQESAVESIDYEEMCCTTTASFKIKAKKIIACTQFPVFQGWHFFVTRFEYKRGYLIAFHSEKKLDGHAYLGLDAPYLSFREATINNQQYTLLSGLHYPIKTQLVDPYQHLIQYAYQHFNAKDIAATWSAQDLFSADARPFIGRVRGDVYVATGYNGWGNTLSIAASQILTQLLLEPGFEVPDFADPARIKDIFSIKFLKNNTDVAVSYIQGLVKPNKDLSSLSNGSIIKLQNRRYGYYKDKNGQEYLVDIHCPHLGCPLRYNAYDSTWDCPCHGSRFSYDGTSLTAPSFVKLQQYPGTNKIHPNFK